MTSSADQDCFANTIDLPLDVKETKSVFKVGLILFNGIGKAR